MNIRGHVLTFAMSALLFAKSAAPQSLPEQAPAAHPADEHRPREAHLFERRRRRLALGRDAAKAPA